MNRILVEQGAVGPDGCVTLRGRQAAHVRTVLRAGAGERIRIGVLDGNRGMGLIQQDEGLPGIRVACTLDEPPLPPSRVHLLLALPRPKVLKRLWPVLGSLGFGRIIITNAAKVERCYFDTHWLEPAVYRDRLIEGLEQSGDTRLPEVRVCRRLKPLVEDELDALFPAAERVAAHPAASRRLREVVPVAAASVLLAVGPEGGWTDYELDLLAAGGFNGVTLGPRILRSDSAVSVLAGLAHDRLGNA